MSDTITTETTCTCGHIAAGHAGLTGQCLVSYKASARLRREGMTAPMAADPCPCTEMTSIQDR